MSARPADRVVPVPFLDLKPMHDEVRSAFLDQTARIVETGGFINGPAVAEFEASFAAYCGTSRCIGVSNGLDALRLALHALGVGQGDEVIVPANTFIATWEAVSQVGAVPVPVDMTVSDYNLDVPAVDAAVTGRTRALLPVHLYGQLADMRSLQELARRHGLPILEDACQAHGATRDGLRAGAGGAAAAFSFYPGKNLGAFGDAGALVTDDAEIDSSVRALREHGQSEKYVHRTVGYTARLDTIQAIALGLKLPHLDFWNEQRRAVAAFYGESLRGVGDLVVPPVPEGSNPVWHLYVVRTAKRDELAQYLRGRGIATGLHYPEPPHLSQAYESLGYRPGSFPQTERFAGELLSLPVYPGMSDEQCAAVADSVRGFFAGP
jgi:dTDP-4-amino-4,6-dideoxygalactose transaminase